MCLCVYIYNSIIAFLLFSFIKNIIKNENKIITKHSYI